MSIRLNTQQILPSENSPPSSRIDFEYGSKENVGFKRLFHFFRRAFPQAFNRDTFQRAYDASDLSKIAYRTKYCCQLKIYGALLATSMFDLKQKRKLKILMLVEDDRSPQARHIGKRLLLQLIDTCKELENILQIYAYVESTNIDGIHFYKMMGFEQREVLHDYFPQRASLTPDAIKLEYRIASSGSEESHSILSPSSMVASVVLDLERRGFELYRSAV